MLSAYPQTEESPSDLAHGLICVRLQVRTGSTAKLGLHSSAELPPKGTWYKQVCGYGWMDFTDSVRQRNRKQALLEVRDGGEGDADGVANGRIVDPFGVSAAPTDGGGSRSDNSTLDGDGDPPPPFGGCAFVPESEAGSGWALMLGSILLILAVRMVLTLRRSQ